jgi:hypothetical protein
VTFAFVVSAGGSLVASSLLMSQRFVSAASADPAAVEMPKMSAREVYFMIIFMLLAPDNY